MKVRHLIMKAAFCCAMFSVAALSVEASHARELSGVSMPEMVSVAHKELRLNGIGVRKEKALFKVYVIALYLEKLTPDAEAVITANQEKHVVLSMLRDFSHEQFVQAVESAMMLNSRGVMPTLRARLDVLEKALPISKKGDVLSFTYLPGVGTLMRGKGQELTIKGKDFADALLSVWLGAKPVSGTLKRQLLAG